MNACVPSAMFNQKKYNFLKKKNIGPKHYFSQNEAKPNLSFLPQFSYRSGESSLSHCGAEDCWGRCEAQAAGRLGRDRLATAGDVVSFL